MKISLPIKIHNKFEAEVKDIITGKIVGRRYAENIILNNMFSSSNFFTESSNSYVGYSMSYGTGSGVLDPARTTLFNHIGQKTRTTVTTVFSQPPNISFSTRKIVIAPEEHVGESISEVGMSGYEFTPTVYTHALLKDSEGNALALEPKTDRQEITIYSTIYLQPNFEDGITFNGSLSTFSRSTDANGLLFQGTLHSYAGSDGTLMVNSLNVGSFRMYKSGSLVKSPLKRIPTNTANVKIKTIEKYRTDSSSAFNQFGIKLNLETLAENSSTIWSGYEFDKAPIGIGDGSKTIFNLTWDEVWMDKPKTIYVDGVQMTSGFTFNEGNITFDTAPADQAVITADYWVKYVPKDSDHVLDIQFDYIFGEGNQYDRNNETRTN